MELYSFQRELVDKFAANSTTHPHVLIGDDMGLGKTVSAIALDRSRRLAQLSELQANWLGNHRKQTLVVTKKSILSSWEDHFKTWAPTAQVISLATHSRDSLMQLALEQKADVFIVNWEALRLMPELSRIPWLHVIGDECQAIKNRKAQVTVAYKRIKALFKTDMSGTWADNKPDDGWSVLNHLYPRVWSSYWTFYNRHVLWRQKVNPKTGQTFREILGVAEEDVLHEAMAPFYVRRLKETVAPDLPEKVHNVIEVDLHPQQRRVYNEMRSQMLAWVGEHESQPISAPVVVAKLVRLQQFAIAYGKIEMVQRNGWRDVPEEVAVKLAWEAEAEGKVAKVRKRLVQGTQDEWLWQAFLTEKVKKLTLTDPSAKLDAVMEWLEQIPSRESAVVFGTSKMAINMLAERLKKVGESYGILTGDVTSDSARRELVDGFQAGRFRVFAGTIKAGGVGITLTRASRMGFIDRDWSPSANRQAEDRIHRIGQSQTCFYTDFVARDTIDTKRNQQIELKWSWLRRLLGDGK